MYEERLFEKIAKLRTDYMKDKGLIKGGLLDTEINKTMLILENYPEPKGEHIILIEGSKIKEETEEEKTIKEMTIEEHYKYYEKQGFTKNEIIKKIAKDKGVNKNEIYQLFI